MATKKQVDYIIKLSDELNHDIGMTKDELNEMRIKDASILISELHQRKEKEMHTNEKTIDIIYKMEDKLGMDNQFNEEELLEMTNLQSKIYLDTLNLMWKIKKAEENGITIPVIVNMEKR